MGMMKPMLWAIISAFLFFSQLSAQKAATRIITGKITASVSKTAVPGATVTVKGTKNMATSGDGGEFSVIAQTGDILVVSSVGYKPKEIKVADGVNNINFELSEDFSNLQDVVVVGYGKMKKTDLSSAVVTISSADLEKTVNVTLDDALQGKSPNVYVSTSSGAPGAGAAVVIRGISTVTGNYEPLYVVDGVQIRPSMATGGAYNSSPGLANELAGINPEDIENISVLEGPAATSIYGAAGANGVLMITTKQGKAGTTKVNFTESQT